ncbi:hypothetical protein AWB64_04597 [Caballeronia sordidicola]|uniref:Uncharacterized protein n=1 Tax=Caballeronia sordidicola TaxID=196367 RepID=A0A158HG34_CABSO|nr:hypothetical protein [Caballeronia sordidicola]SAL43338.1 hypothetical protein AWB64_04597 [Caballeronia sordidicola]
MPIWSPASLEAEPKISLLSWHIIETELDECHFIGVRPDTKAARISSPIYQFDSLSKLGVTSTGRRYQLIGDPGWSYDTVYLLVNWARQYGVISCDDVTDSFLGSSPQRVFGGTLLQ